jgi:hypothetical protein
MPKSMKRKANVNYRPRKRTIKRKSPLKKQYTRVKQQQKIRKMKRVVKRARSRAISAMSVLRQPEKVVMKFKTQACKVYRLHDDTGASNTTVSGGTPTQDNNPVFPKEGLVINQNSIYEPGDLLPKCGGFTDVSHQYSKYRVIGTKIVFKVRRMGTSIPMQVSSFNNFITQQVTSNGVSATPAMLAGTAMDPDNSDPLLVTAFDRSAWQDVNSMVRDDPTEGDTFTGNALGWKAIKGYADVQKYKHLKGLTWRELKPGVGATSTIIHKWTEKGLTALGMNTDYRQINTGLFHNEQGSWTSGGASPTTLDHVRFNIKEFDEYNSINKSKLSNPRIMVTIDVDYLVLCSEPRYSYSQPN